MPRSPTNSLLRRRSDLPEFKGGRSVLTSVTAVCRCVYQREDEKGRVGVELNRDLVKVAGKALEKNLTRLGPLVLPVGEQLRFAANFVQRRLLGRRSVKPYQPDFTKAFNHFCLHAGAPFFSYGEQERWLGSHILRHTLPSVWADLQHEIQCMPFCICSELRAAYLRLHQLTGECDPRL